MPIKHVYPNHDAEKASVSGFESLHGGRETPTSVQTSSDNEQDINNIFQLQVRNWKTILSPVGNYFIWVMDIKYQPEKHEHLRHASKPTHMEILVVQLQIHLRFSASAYARLYLSASDVWSSSPIFEKEIVMWELFNWPSNYVNNLIFCLNS